MDVPCTGVVRTYVRMNVRTYVKNVRAYVLYVRSYAYGPLRAYVRKQSLTPQLGPSDVLLLPKLRKSEKI